MKKSTNGTGWKWSVLLMAVGLLIIATTLCLWWLPPDGRRNAPTETVKTTGTTTSSTVATPHKEALSVTSHQQGTTTTNEPFTTFTGTSDPSHSLEINGKAVERDESGAFSVEYALELGDNAFSFTHKGETTVYTVRYQYLVMQAFAPAGDRRYKSGATFSVLVAARTGSQVTATFQGSTIPLNVASGQADAIMGNETFVHYTGTFKLPRSNTADMELGTIVFTATYQGQTDTGESGVIVCEKMGDSVIGEVVSFSAETFNGDTIDDDSRPTNNYFPTGTVDYVVGYTYYGDKEYLLLRCGRRVYVSKEVSPPTQTLRVTREYTGVLPDTNQLSLDAVRVTADATYITLNTNWRAPFFLNLLPQDYQDASKQDYRVTDVTARYVEITFCYADALTGNFTFDKNHPLFSHATVTRSGNATVLRLYLQRQGGFYGWDAYYNSTGQLEFYFLHPARVTVADNEYGANLQGVTIMLDVGHSYSAGGAPGLDSAHPEEERNYYLATLIKKELESIGAMVVLNRTATEDLNQDQRCIRLKNTKPDLCIAVHHDSNASSKPNGFGALYALPYAYNAAKCIYDATMATGIYDSQTPGNDNRLEWHYYFVARMTDCPVVLTENGYMSSRVDHQGIVSEQTNLEKAKAIAKGVAAYFLSVSSARSDAPTP